jgi:hypothetical protein
MWRPLPNMHCVLLGCARHLWVSGTRKKQVPNRRSSLISEGHLTMRNYGISHQLTWKLTGVWDINCCVTACEWWEYNYAIVESAWGSHGLQQSCRYLPSLIPHEWHSEDIVLGLLLQKIDPRVQSQGNWTVKLPRFPTSRHMHTLHGLHV